MKSRGKAKTMYGAQDLQELKYKNSSKLVQEKMQDKRQSHAEDQRSNYKFQ